jgi:hypothetical protein
MISKIVVISYFHFIIYIEQLWSVSLEKNIGIWIELLTLGMIAFLLYLLFLCFWVNFHIIFFKI